MDEKAATEFTDALADAVPDEEALKADEAEAEAIRDRVRGEAIKADIAAVQKGLADKARAGNALKAAEDKRTRRKERNKRLWKAEQRSFRA